MASVTSSSIISEGDYIVKEVKELNFFDLTGERSKTIGSSSKSYHAEIQVSKKTSEAQIYTCYGPTGKVQAKDYRCFDSEAVAKKEFDKIIKSKLKKGYVEIDVAQRSIGSDEAKAITKAVTFKNAENIVKNDSDSSNKISKEVSALIKKLMGSTNQFVIETLKCPLGQLTNNQIDEGQKRLDEAKIIIQNKTPDKKRIEELTNQFYSLIPHNLGSGYRGIMNELLLDSVEKIAKKEYDLDTLLDAKALGVNLVTDSTYTQYQSLQTEINYIDPKSELFGWINRMIQDTRANNHHHLGKIVLLNAYSIERNKEKDVFIKRAEQIAKECGKQVIPDMIKHLVEKRTDIANDYKSLFTKSNILPLFHGSRTENMTGIMSKGLMIRPSGVILTGGYFGCGLYFAKNATKSINYCSIKNSYWARGNDNSAYMFLADCALGNQKFAPTGYQYTKKNIHPFHSVIAIGGKSSVANDEFMTYDTDQHNLKYLLEFSCDQK